MYLKNTCVNTNMQNDMHMVIHCGFICKGKGLDTNQTSHKSGWIN